MLDSVQRLSLALLVAALAAFVAAPTQAQTPTTTIQNGNADTRLQLNYDGGLLVPGTFGSTTPADSIPASGTGTRLMWYPAKAALRAGRVGNRLDGTQWDATKVGDYSVAMGVDTKASGRSATAMGDNTSATKDGAVAMGVSSDAEGSSAVAMGKSSTATGAFAVAIGRQANAEGQSSVALGGFTDATGDAAKALGGTASGLGAVSMNRATASGQNAVAMGWGEASGTRAVAMGRATVAATNQSLSTGICNSANTTADNTLLAVGNGTFDTESFACSSESDALVLKENGDLTISGGLTENSDRRLKTGIEPIGEDVLQKLSRLRPVRYEFKDQSTHPSGEQIGLVAQDVRKEFPSLVSKGAGGYLSLAYPKMTAVLLKGIQEQQAELETKKQEIANLKAENEEIKERLAALERQHSSALPAGLVGPLGLAVLLGLGGLSVGLLWRRRG